MEEAPLTEPAGKNPLLHFIDRLTGVSEQCLANDMLSSVRPSVCLSSVVGRL